MSETRVGTHVRGQVRDNPRETMPTEEGQLKRLVRTKKGVGSEFDIDPRLVPEGMTWEWKREENVGKVDAPYMASLMSNHWHAVDASRVGNMALPGQTGPFKHGGLVLMERPSYLSEEARQEELDAAFGRAREVERQMGVSNPNELPRFTGRRPGDKAVKRTYEAHTRMRIPD